jgi:hypothetical protein
MKEQVRLPPPPPASTLHIVPSEGCRAVTQRVKAGYSEPQWSEAPSYAPARQPSFQRLRMAGRNKIFNSIPKIKDVSETLVNLIESQK